MNTAIPYLVVLVILAIVLDILFVRGLHKYRELKQQATDADGKLTLGQFELLRQAFLGNTFKRNTARHSNTVTAKGPITSSQLLSFALEWLLIIVIAYFYCGETLLNFDANKLQQSGEHDASATLPMLAEIGLLRYGQIPLWNPYMLTGFPHVGDPLGHFWHPTSTIPIMIWGGINGMKVSIFLAFVIAGLGQWMFAYVLKLQRTFRLWSAILFMISGGLAMLWRVGWYELLLGAAWFPWCFALYIHALRRHTLPSIFFMSIAIFMIISTGGGYYPFYLLGCLITIFLVMFLMTARDQRLRLIQTSGLILLFSVAICAVILLPFMDVFKLYGRDVFTDTTQQFSQPVEYGLMNFVIYTPDWFNANVLGTAGGWNWFYIGWLPVAALAFIPSTLSQSSRLRKPVWISGALFAILIMWFANRFTPFEKVFDWFPYLYNLRFPNRLLIIATSPLLILSALGLEHAYRLSKAWVRDIKLVYSPRGKKNRVIFAHFIITWLWIIALVSLLRPVYDVNQRFAFIDQNLNPKALAALSWLKTYDNSLYYVNIGGGVIYWDWTETAFQLEQPMINFLYSRHLRTQEVQQTSMSPFIARAKYQISLEGEPVPDNSIKIREFEGVYIWRVPNVLPYAFSAPTELTQYYAHLTTDKVTPIKVRLNGPNQVIARGEPGHAGEDLVVLMSYFPGWHLLIDGHPAEVTPINDYLGAKMLPGIHTYQFYFLPMKYIIGATISALTFLFMVVYLLWEPVKVVIGKYHRERTPAVTPNVTP